MTDNARFWAAMARLTMAREAAASVALSHPDKCTCTVCRAAHGDERAVALVLEVLDRP